MATCQLTVGFISSGDSGATWHAPQTLSPPMNVTWAPNTTQGRMVGDYFSTSFVNHEAHPVFVIGTAAAGTAEPDLPRAPLGGRDHRAARRGPTPHEE